MTLAREPWDRREPEPRHGERLSLQRRPSASGRTHLTRIFSVRSDNTPATSSGGRGREAGIRGTRGSTYTRGDGNEVTTMAFDSPMTVEIA